MRVREHGGAHRAQTLKRETRKNAIVLQTERERLVQVFYGALPLKIAWAAQCSAQRRDEHVTIKLSQVN